MSAPVVPFRFDVLILSILPWWGVIGAVLGRWTHVSAPTRIEACRLVLRSEVEEVWRRPGRLGPRRSGLKSEVQEDARGSLGFGDRFEDPAPPTAAGAAQDVHEKHPPQQIGPREAMRHLLSGSQRRRGPAFSRRHDARAAGGSGCEEPVVPD